MQKDDIIISYSFHGNTSHYFIGRVVNVEEEMITCETLKRVADGESLPIKSPTFQAPVNGAHFMDNGKFTRIIKLG